MSKPSKPERDFTAEWSKGIRNMKFRDNPTHPPAKPQAEPRSVPLWCGHDPEGCDCTGSCAVEMSAALFAAEAALRAERARAQAAEKEVGRLREALEQIKVQCSPHGSRAPIRELARAALDAPGHQGEEGK